MTNGGIEPDSDVRIACYTALPVVTGLAAVVIVLGLFAGVLGGLL